MNKDYAAANCYTYEASMFPANEVPVSGRNIIKKVAQIWRPHYYFNC